MTQDMLDYIEARRRPVRWPWLAYLAATAVLAAVVGWWW